jgi:hypothetical protein
MKPMPTSTEWISHLLRLVTDCLSISGYLSWDEYDGDKGAGFEVYPSPMRLAEDESTVVFPLDLTVDLGQLLKIPDAVETFEWDEDGAVGLQATFAGNPFMLRILRSPPDGADPIGVLMKDGTVVEDGEFPKAAGGEFN